MRFSSAIYIAGALLVPGAVTQVDPNVVRKSMKSSLHSETFVLTEPKAISGADAIPVGQQIVGPDAAAAAAAAAASLQAAAQQAAAEAAKIFLPSASACPGEVKCRKGPPIVIDKPRHKETITETVWTATTVNTVSL
jgi:hypothetical protein